MAVADNLLQDLSIRRKTRDRAERQFTQLLLSDGGQKKPAGKNPVGEKSRQEIWVETRGSQWGVRLTVDG